MAFSSKLRPELEIIYPEDYALLRKLDIENKKRQ